MPPAPAAAHHRGMNVPENLFLVGFMGSGKSTVGQRLAAELGKEFLDCDRVLEERTGVDIPYIFEIEGEEGFRRREAAVLRDLTGRRGIVLATGGGAVGDPENRKVLIANGFVIYLRAPGGSPVSAHVARSGPADAVCEGSAQAHRRAARGERPLYREVADLILDTGWRGSRRVIQEALRAFSDRGAAWSPRTADGDGMNDS